MSFFSELRRRNVIRVAAAYIVIGWLLLQVADILTPALHLPEWVLSAIALVLILGILPVLLFSWAYELTPDGLKKDSEVDKTTSDTSQTAKKLDVITIVAVVGIAALIIWQQANPPSQSQAESSDVTSPALAAGVIDASIAVLPFADLSPDGDQSHFSDGIAEEILNVLVRVESLKVASRTSAFGFKGQEALGIPLIAERLQVRHVLEGSVRKAGNTVRITAQLIDAKTDAHLWSETYDRELSAENIFSVQDEIAGAIVAQLGEMLGDDSLDQAHVKVKTNNLDAYDSFLKAQSLFHARSFETIPEMISLYEQAVAIDPDFAEAWAGLSAAHLVAPGWNIGPMDEHYSLARDAADRATALDDNLALPYSVRGSIVTELGDIVGGIEQIDIAVQRDPMSIEAIYFRAALYLELGYLKLAEAEFERCLELDSEYEICRRFLSFALLYQRQGEAAAKLFEAGILKGQDSFKYVFIAYYSSIGDTRALTFLIAETLENSVSDREFEYRLATDDSYRLDDYNADRRAATQRILGEDAPFEEITLEYMAEFWSHSDFLWNPYQPILRRPELRDEYIQVHKRKVLETGIHDYWRKYGFPPQCRPLGDDDFECDQYQDGYGEIGK